MHRSDEAAIVVTARQWIDDLRQFKLYRGDLEPLAACIEGLIAEIDRASVGTCPHCQVIVRVGEPRSLRPEEADNAVQS